MSTTKKLVAYHIGRLKDKDVQVRLKAIQELAELGEADALDPLREAFEKDADLDVRKAAQEAGRLIFLRQQQASQR